MKCAMVVVLFALAGCGGARQQNDAPAEHDAAHRDSVETRPPNGAGQTPAFPGQTRAPERNANVAFEVVTVAEGLQNPWGMTFLPDGRLLVTETPGRLRVVRA